MSGDGIKISVVVISFNGKRFVEDCLASVIDSFHTDSYEIIVIDNGSSDGSVDIVKSKFPDLKLISNEKNLGFAPAVNQGLKTANGEYILILNQDTKIQDNAIEKLAERMETDPTIGSIGPKFIGFDGKLQKCARAFPKYRDLLWQYTGLSCLFPESKIFNRWKMGWFDHLTEREVDQPMGAALLISKETVKRVGYFDESFPIFFNDVDYCHRIQEAGMKNLYYPDAIVMHYVGGSTERMKAKMIIESHRSMYHYFKKYGRGGVTLPCQWFWGAVLFVTARLRALFAQ